MPRQGLNKKIIVDKAAILAQEKGLENITLHELAEVLGVKTASLYNHLQGLPELSARLAELALTRLMESLRSAIGNREGAEAFAALAQAYRAFSHEQPELYKAMLSLPQFADTRLLELKNEFMHIFREVLAPYGFPETKQIHLSRMLRSVLHGFVALESAGFFKGPADADESYALLVRNQATLFAGGEGAYMHGN